MSTIPAPTPYFTRCSAIAIAAPIFLRVKSLLRFSPVSSFRVVVQSDRYRFPEGCDELRRRVKAVEILSIKKTPIRWFARPPILTSSNICRMSCPISIPINGRKILKCQLLDILYRYRNQAGHHDRLRHEFVPAAQFIID